MNQVSESTLCRTISFRDQQPLLTNSGETIAIYCGGRTLELFSSQGTAVIGSGGTVEFYDCHISFYDGTWAARNLDPQGPQDVTTNAISGPGGSWLRLRDSTMLMPYKVPRSHHIMRGICVVECPCTPAERLVQVVHIAVCASLVATYALDRVHRARVHRRSNCLSAAAGRLAPHASRQPRCSFSVSGIGTDVQSPV
jgi:hypothetical protein